MSQPNQPTPANPCTPANAAKPKLLDQVRNHCRVRHLALSTEKQYVQWIRRFILFHNKRHPLEMGKAEVSAFLTHLAVEGNVSASTQNQALAALLFLYRAVNDYPTAKQHVLGSQWSFTRGIQNSQPTPMRS